MALAAIALAIAITAPAARAGWDVRKFENRDYVTLESFCEFYGFPYKDPDDAEFFKTTNGRHEMIIRINSRIIYVNGVRHWMSFGAYRYKDDDQFKDGRGPWMISKLDIIKLFEPLLRPHMIKERRPVRGVVLDAGHGGNDNGAGTSRAQHEKVYTLDMVFRIQKLLQAAGIKTVLTRRSDVFVDLDARAQIAKRYPGFIFVSIHFNSAVTDARGLETYACTPQGASSSSEGNKLPMRSDYQRQINNDEDARNALLAYEIQRQMIKLWPGDEEADRGVKRARFVVLRKNELPAVLVEGGFLSNKREVRSIASDSYRDKLAIAVANGIKNFILQMEPQPQRVTSPTVRGPTIDTSPPSPVPKPPEEKPAPKPPAEKPKPEAKPPSQPDEKPAPKPQPPAPEAPPAKPAKPRETEPETTIYGD